MSQPSPSPETPQAPMWFERKFDFSFPVELFPNLCIRLRGTPARLEEFTHGVDPKILTARPSEASDQRKVEKWSAQEHAGHLLDLESLWIARTVDFVGGSNTLTPADLTNRKTHEANHNSQPIAGILKNFRLERLTLLDRLKDLSGSVLSRTLLHPRLQQPMRLVDHLFFVAEHDDHHLARIWQLRPQGC